MPAANTSQLRQHPARTVKRPLQINFINPLHQLEIIVADRLGFVICL